MSLHFFIDGYNVIRSTDWLSAGALDAQRERLVKFVDEQRPSGSTRNNVTIVFDGKPGRVITAGRNGIHVIFSEDVDADTVIKREVDACSNPASAVVVTNDRAIQKWVRGAGARILSCEQFLRPKTKQTFLAPWDELDAATRQSINNELKRVWKLK